MSYFWIGRYLTTVRSLIYISYSQYATVQPQFTFLIANYRWGMRNLICIFVLICCQPRLFETNVQIRGGSDLLVGGIFSDDPYQQMDYQVRPMHFLWQNTFYSTGNIWSTVRPWDARFGVKEKTRAAQNSCNFCYLIGWRQNDQKTVLLKVFTI